MRKFRGRCPRLLTAALSGRLPRALLRLIVKHQVWELSLFPREPRLQTIVRRIALITLAHRVAARNREFVRGLAQVLPHQRQLKTTRRLFAPHAARAPRTTPTHCRAAPRSIFLLPFARCSGHPPRRSKLSAVLFKHVLTRFNPCATLRLSASQPTRQLPHGPQQVSLMPPPAWQLHPFD